MTTPEVSLSLPIVIPLIGLAYALYNVHWVLSRRVDNEKLSELSDLIAKGAETFLKREYSLILPTGVALMVIIGFVYYAIFHSASLAAYAVLSFALGALGSGLAGYVGMYVTTRSSSRTTTAARRGIGEALKVSFRAGSVMGVMLASAAVLTVSSLYVVYSALTRDWAITLAPVALGASLMSLFIRVAGGIYTKAADWGADMVGKVESNIPEDDPRNPGVIADNVGDNVGDVAGMASDVYESFIVVLTGTLILISVFNMPEALASLTLALTSLVLLATLLGVQVVRGDVKGEDLASASMRKLGNALTATVLIGSALTIGYSLVSLRNTLEAIASSLSVVMGFITAVAVLYVTQYFTHYTYSPVKDIARQAVFSASNVIVTGYSYGLLSAAPIIAIVALALGASFYLGYSYIPTSMPIEGGVMGTALASVGLLSLAGVVISLDSYGPVSDNANGLAEMTGLGGEVRRVTDALDAIGNTYKATTKGYAIASAGLAALVLFIGFIYEVLSYNNPNTDVLSTALSYLSIVNPMLLVGILIGAILVYVFSSRLLIAVGKAASELVEEIRRQFSTRKILEGLEKPDYNKAIDIVTRHALREFMAPALLAVAIPVIVGLTLGWVALAGLILGTIIVGLPRALLMANAGGAWDNAKKFIEAELDPGLGGKGSIAHKNAVIGDVVGDPFKDTAGPSLNPLIKVVNTVSIVFAPAVALMSTMNPLTHLGYLILLAISLI
ncbi:MAG: sodium-translocating pyrophosphatase [Caldivirga sp.]|jgi:K(+)-stimulated pyrophosphate-energized sodium pump|uniref:sodium-translocating pyrophosphatase n=1 Tax=Caldivirga sp. MU80 TaxID=1650354 RepID=UPI00082B9B86|nr:sodium-translocating pyrophosphatase [Caldivirga sp. MU80]